ncbi:methyltransferase domain-containing protein [Campylobacter coli]|nr:methyltransferase domain-containing protein [Campylobacter coli]EAH8378267.1 methyltransferase domain-containing protein [Campylobacter coli]EAI9296228.1 methyltransferase domain-containing protein [Campylobacter coli]EAJ4481703.1 methyltransferase domain-containing protein [Campylobacter coli]EGK4405615.1 methyltransferase domain-containing protein [Campylobacter coli]
MQKLVEQVWDYTKHAKFYSYRPNYAPKTIDMLISLVGKNDIKVADIGAGTGNLSIMLLERGCKVVSVEPNDAMREIGIERTKGEKIEWVRATGLNSTLQNSEFDWVTFGSSFNVMDRNEALKETHRLLKSEGYFSCMWNHRDLNDPIQKIAEDTIIEFVPNYTRGTRREDQRPIIESRKDLFDNIVYIEEDFYFHQSIENYINAWKSVKNPYWDLETEEGNELFNKISDKISQRLPKEFSIKYTTCCWSAKKI